MLFDKNGQLTRKNSSSSKTSEATNLSKSTLSPLEFHSLCDTLCLPLPIISNLVKIKDEAETLIHIQIWAHKLKSIWPVLCTSVASYHFHFKDEDKIKTNDPNPERNSLPKSPGNKFIQQSEHFNQNLKNFNLNDVGIKNERRLINTFSSSQFNSTAFSAVNNSSFLNSQQDQDIPMEDVSNSCQSQSQIMPPQIQQTTSNIDKTTENEEDPFFSSPASTSVSMMKSFFHQRKGNISKLTNHCSILPFLVIMKQMSSKLRCAIVMLSTQFQECLFNLARLQKELDRISKMNEGFAAEFLSSAAAAASKTASLTANIQFYQNKVILSEYEKVIVSRIEYLLQGCPIQLNFSKNSQIDEKLGKFSSSFVCLGLDLRDWDEIKQDITNKLNSKQEKDQILSKSQSNIINQDQNPAKSSQNPEKNAIYTQNLLDEPQNIITSTMNLFTCASASSVTSTNLNSVVPPIQSQNLKKEEPKKVPPKANNPVIGSQQPEISNQSQKPNKVSPTKASTSPESTQNKKDGSPNSSKIVAQKRKREIEEKEDDKIVEDDDDEEEEEHEGDEEEDEEMEDKDLFEKKGSLNQSVAQQQPHAVASSNPPKKKSKRRRVVRKGK